MAMPTQEQISEMLVKHKMNVFTWSKWRGYKCKTVYGAIKQWAGRDDRTPHGGIARMIMRDLTADIEAANCRNFDAVVATEVATKESDVATHNNLNLKGIVL